MTDLPKEINQRDTIDESASSNASPQIAESPSLIGKTLGGKYTIIEKIGSGGMGVVFKAEQKFVDRIVAIKILHSHLTANETFRKRFQHEAKISSQIRHPNAVTLYDFGFEGDMPYLVLEYVEGKTLTQIISETGPLKLERIAAILSQVGSALSEAHSLGIVHRDLKPDNILLVKSPSGIEQATVLDFGIAKALHRTPEQATAPVTQVGMVMGTPQYISPEQALEKELDARSDIYSLGVILFEMISGEVPFKGTSPMEVCIQHLRSDPPILRILKPELEIPLPVQEVVARALAKDPNERFQSIHEMVEAFSVAACGVILKANLNEFLIRPEVTAPELQSFSFATPISETPPTEEEPANPEKLVGGVPLGEKTSMSLTQAVEAIRKGNETPPLARRWLTPVLGALSAAAIILALVYQGSSEHKQELDAQVEEQNQETPSTGAEQNTTATKIDLASARAMAPLPKDDTTENEIHELPLSSEPSGATTLENPNSLLSQAARGFRAGLDVLSVSPSELSHIIQGESSSAVEAPTAETESENASGQSQENGIARLGEENPSESQEQVASPNDISSNVPAQDTQLEESPTDPSRLIASTTELSSETSKASPLKISAKTKAEAEKLHKEGQKLLDKKDFLGAGLLFKQAVLLDEENLEARLSLGVCLMKLQKFDKAKEIFHGALALDSEYAPTHYNLASYYSLTGQIESALASFERAYQLFPGVKKWAELDEDLANLKNDPRYLGLFPNSGLSKK